MGFKVSQAQLEISVKYFRDCRSHNFRLSKLSIYLGPVNQLNQSFVSLSRVTSEEQ